MILTLRPAGISPESRIHIGPRSGYAARVMQPTEGTGRRTTPVVLVVDDDEYVHAALAAALRSLKPEVIRATTAEEGLGMAIERVPDIAIIDLGLPDTDGYSLTRRIRAIAELRDTRILILTGHLPDQDAARDAGADAILAKPFRLNEFLATIETLRSLPAGT
jgi:DNA-binding response OmpR family regulator